MVCSAEPMSCCHEWTYGWLEFCFLMPSLLFQRPSVRPCLRVLTSGCKIPLSLSLSAFQKHGQSQQQLTGIAMQCAGWSTLMENILDPSHIKFAHAGVIGDRSAACKSLLRKWWPVAHTQKVAAHIIVHPIVSAEALLLLIEITLSGNSGDQDGAHLSRMQSPL